MEDFRSTGESTTAVRLRIQEEMFLKASAALSDKVNAIVLSGHWIILWLSSYINYIAITSN